ncbi:MAG: D-alanine--D-alanine ligase [Eubacterium sp.]|jgi:D-alanine---D-serine ligase|nr:D-alanine--D-alanine ligase [Eubacterium sp.]
MEKRKVAVLFGGCSTEYEVSLKSAASVIDNLNKDLYEIILVGITREGEWFRYFGAVGGIKNDTWHRDKNCRSAVFSPDRNLHALIEFWEDRFVTTQIDVVFPVMHGKNSEDGTVQGLLELAGIPFVGCDTLSSALCMDKDIAHKLAQSAGVRVPPSITAVKYMKITEIIRRTETLRYPLFVKPAKAGSSFGITRVASPEGLYDAIIEAFRHDSKIIVEEGIEGFEVGCAVLGNDELIIGEVDEIELQKGFFDYTEKYNLVSSKIHMPARLDRQTADRIRETAVKLYNTLCCRGFARVDMFLTPAGHIVFNEINTIPGFTAHSRYPKMLAGIGMSFENILDKLIALALEEEN